jgi:hypothetical protein
MERQISGLDFVIAEEINKKQNCIASSHIWVLIVHRHKQLARILSRYRTNRLDEVSYIA